MKREVKAIEAAIFICIASCRVAVWFDHSQQNPETVYAPPAKVSWSSIPSREQKDILTVAKDFGEANPKVVKIISDTTEADFCRCILFG